MIPLLAAALIFALAAAPATADTSAGAPFAMVELFTSEGCSSCPPADQLVSEIAREAAREGRNVIALEFHVDYWNSVAWMDRWSDAAHSERQRRYASSLGSEVYTPQAVVNGRLACVGSDRARLRQAIAAELKRPARAAISIESAPMSGHPAIRYRVTGASSEARMCAALTESGLSSRVLGGENAGRVLTHDGVVREFIARPLGEEPSGVVRFASGPNSHHPRRVVLFVQDPSSLEILAAASLPL